MSHCPKSAQDPHAFRTLAFGSFKHGRPALFSTMKSDTALAIASALRAQFERPWPTLRPQFEDLRHNLAEGVIEISQSVVPTLAFGACRRTIERRINDHTLKTTNALGGTIVSAESTKVLAAQTRPCHPSPAPHGRPRHGKARWLAPDPERAVSRAWISRPRRRKSALSAARRDYGDPSAARGYCEAHPRRVVHDGSRLLGKVPIYALRGESRTVVWRGLQYPTATSPFVQPDCLPSCGGRRARVARRRLTLSAVGDALGAALHYSPQPRGSNAIRVLRPRSLQRRTA